MSEWRQAQVHIPGCIGTHPAEIRTDVLWNGWVVPRFTRAEAEALARETRALAETGADCEVLMLTSDGSLSYRLINWYDGKPDPDPAAEVEIVHAADGWYYVGAWAWCWEEAI